MSFKEKIRVGIGFATGRKSFQQVLRTNIFTWKESGLIEDENVSLNLFVAYDLDYNNTQKEDYTHMSRELISQVDRRCFIGEAWIQRMIDELVSENIVSEQEAQMLFCGGYAGKRNALLFAAIKEGMDYLIFLDDDEYPMAVTGTRSTLVWGGQHVLRTHLKYISQADITHGHHCGYISPIPYVAYNEQLKEDEFRRFIEAISNDIVNWDTIRNVMKNGGVTYADTRVLTNDDAFEVSERNGAKFISGANLCINLKDPNRIFPFYNPPGARGEDTFLSTCLTQRRVLRVPCYTFHDGFSTYNHLLHGVLPIRLRFIHAEDERIVTRFYKACVGWVRYKPLLLFLTQPDRYEQAIGQMQEQLTETLPSICKYFHSKRFMNVLSELKAYHKDVRIHAQEFADTKSAWAKIMAHFAQEDAS